MKVFQLQLPYVFHLYDFPSKSILALLMIFIFSFFGKAQIPDTTYLEIKAKIIQAGENENYDLTRELCRQAQKKNLSPLQNAYLQRYIMLTFLEEGREDSTRFYLDYLKEYIQTIEKVDSRHATDIINDVATLTYSEDETFKAYEYFLPFLDMVDTSQNSGKEAYAKLLVGLYLKKQSYEYSNHWYDNIKQIKESIRLLEEIHGKHDTVVGDRYYDLAFVYSEIEHHKLAIDNYKLALKIYDKKSHPIPNDIALLHNNISYNYTRLGLYDIALVHVRKAADIWREDPDLRSYYNTALSGMVEANEKLGFHKEAQLLNIELIKYYRENNNIQALIPNLISQFYYSGKSPVNNPHLAEAKKLIDSVKMPQRELLLLSKYVNYYSDRMYHDTKIQPVIHDTFIYNQLQYYVGKMSALYQEIDIESKGADYLMYSQNILYGDGSMITLIEQEIDLMEKLPRDVLGLRKNYMDHISELQFLYNLIISYHIKHKNTQKLKEIAQVMSKRMYLIFGPEFNWELEDMLKYETSFQLAAYLTWYASVINYLDEIEESTTEVSDNLATIKYILAYVENIHTNHRHLKPEYQRLHKYISQISIDFILRNQDNILEAKGELIRVLHIYSGSKNAKQFIINQFKENTELRDSFVRYQELKNQRKLLISRLSSLSDNSKEYHEEGSEIKELNERESSLKDFLNSDRNLVYEPISLLLKDPVNPEKVIPQDKCIIQFCLFTDSLYAIGISRTEMIIKKIPLSTVDAISKDIPEVFNLDSIVMRNSDELKELTHNLLVELYQSMVEPVLVRDVESITFIPDEHLFNFPFHIALADLSIDKPYEKWPYLMRNKHISYAYSWENFISAHRTPASQLNIATIAFNTDPEGRNNLEEASSEVASIAKMFSGDSYIGNSLTSDSLLNLLKSYNVVHIVTHGVIRDSTDKSISLLLSEEQMDRSNLNISDLYFQQNNHRLISISACNSGYTIDWDGELASTSIGRAFENSGVSTVVMSLWEIPDKIGSQIMTDFYRHLKTGEAMDVALGESYKEFLDENNKPHLMHPYYWSAFIVNGETSPIGENIETGSGLKMLLIIGLVIILFLIVLLLIRKRREKSENIV